MKALTRMLTFSFVALAVIAMGGCGVSKDDYSAMRDAGQSRQP